jgi:hypothetical protein
MTESTTYGIDLLWIPLGAGGWFVRLNGRVWEAAQALREHRRPAALFHTGLEVHVPAGRFVIENAWPIPDTLGAGRGVVVEGPVFARSLGRMRTFRYEVRRWPGGAIYDAAWAVGGPTRITDDVTVAERLLALLPSMSPHVWGRRVPETGDMWNSNSTISWVLTRSGFPAVDLEPPAGGRAPGWQAGIAVAEHEMVVGRKGIQSTGVGSS